MTQLIARLVLAMLLLPFALLIFGGGMAVVASLGPGPPAGGFLITWIVTAIFVVVYWIGLWRSSVNWTQKRQTLTACCVLYGVVGAAVLYGILRNVAEIPKEPAILFSGCVFPVAFVLSTVLLWRETPMERHLRIASRGTDAVSCPTCGYNMTGLREARCPECGLSFTLDELLTSQRSDEQGELSED